MYLNIEAFDVTSSTPCTIDKVKKLILHPVSEDCNIKFNGGETVSLKLGQTITIENDADTEVGPTTIEADDNDTELTVIVLCE